MCCYYIQCYSFVFKALMQPGAPPSSRSPVHRATCSRPGGVSHSAARVFDSCWPSCWPKVAISPSAMPTSGSSQRRGRDNKGGSRNSQMCCSKYLIFAKATTHFDCRRRLLVSLCCSYLSVISPGDSPTSDSAVYTRANVGK